MNRVHLAALAFALILLLIFFHYIYVRSVQSEMLAQVEQLSASYHSPVPPDNAEKLWKSRKRLLSHTLPLTAIEKIDLQFSELRACAEAQDSSAYLRACYALHRLLSSLDR